MNLKTKENWTIRLQGPLGKVLEHFSACRLEKIDFNALLEPLRQRKGASCGRELLLWGQAVETSALACRYLDNSKLQSKVRQAVNELIELQKENKALSAYPEALQLQQWDLYARRSLLKALTAAFRTLGEKEAVRQCCLDMTAALMAQVGEGKRSILHCGQTGGLDSSAILDAVVEVWLISGDEEILDFARYIAGCGCSQQHNIFSALQTGLAPSELGNGHGIYLNNCFQGIAELSLHDRENAPFWRNCCRIYLDKLIAEELFVTGSAGGKNDEGSYWCRGALAQGEKKCQGGSFGNSAVTVSNLQLFEALHRALQTPLPVSWAERACYNALLGAWDPGACSWNFRNPTPLTGPCIKEYAASGQPFDFCSFAAASGIALAPALAALPLKEEEGLRINFYEDMELTSTSGTTVRISGNFPASDRVTLKIKSRKKFPLSLRIPEYCTGVYYEDCQLKAEKNSYLTLNRSWSEEETLTLVFDTKVRVVPLPGKQPFQTLMLGPLLLAESSGEEPAEYLRKVQYNKRPLIDYASAGRPLNGNAPFNILFPLQEYAYLLNYFNRD